MMTVNYWIALAVVEVFAVALTTMALENKRNKTALIKYAIAIIGMAILYTLVCVAYGVI